MNKAKQKTRLSLVLRENDEFFHSKGINSLALGRAYERPEAQRSLPCRHLISGGRDGKIRLWEAQHSQYYRNDGAAASGAPGGGYVQRGLGGAQSSQMQFND